MKLPYLIILTFLACSVLIAEDSTSILLSKIKRCDGRLENEKKLLPNYHELVMFNMRHSSSFEGWDPPSFINVIEDNYIDQPNHKTRNTFFSNNKKVTNVITKCARTICLDFQNHHDGGFNLFVLVPTIADKDKIQSYLDKGIKLHIELLTASDCGVHDSNKLH